MSLETDEFIRRFLIHVLPSGFHRIRHYGLFANGQRKHNIAKARQLLNVKTPHEMNDDEAALETLPPNWLLCPACGTTMRIVDVFDSAHVPHPPQHRAGDPPCPDCVKR